MTLVRKTLISAICLIGLCSVQCAAFAADAAVLADRHQAKGLGCVMCHGTDKPEPFAEVPADKCLACHGSRAALAKKTEKWGKRNPHDNHLGEVECSVCHKGHQKSASYCSNCHKDFTMPMK